MGENQEQQEEELEVLKSIYEGDECYTNPDKLKHRYKFGEDSTSRSFILGWYLEIDKNYFTLGHLNRNMLGLRISFRTARNQFRIFLQRTSHS